MRYSDTSITNISETSAVELVDCTLNNHISYIECDKVRIYPKSLFFENAFEGKVFNQPFRVINYGKDIATVRVHAPRSKSFKIKNVDTKYCLPCGMSKTWNIRHTFSRTLNIPLIIIPIIINDKIIDYPVKVSVSAPKIILSPQCVDFGKMDADGTFSLRHLSLTNVGSKSTYFAIDLGRNNVDMMVTPMKGSIQASETIKLRIEIMGTDPGPVLREFWVKTIQPKRVRVLGSFIVPSLTPLHPNPTFIYTMIDFPKAYYGTKFSKVLVIQNYSSTSVMYCLIANTETGFKTWDEAQEVDKNYKCFDVSSSQGRIMSMKKTIIQITFQPKKFRDFKKEYAICFLNILKLDFRDIDGSQYDLFCTKDIIPRKEPVSILEDDNIQTELDTKKLVPLPDSIKVIFNGEMEQAAVELCPPCFILNYLTLNKVYSYELFIKNKSKNLPIIFSFQRTSCVVIIPTRGWLEPEGSTEILVKLRPSKLGEFKTKIIVDLLFYNFPREGLVKVGEASIDVMLDADKTEKTEKSECYPKEDYKFPFSPPVESEWKLFDEFMKKKIGDNDKYREILRAHAERMKKREPVPPVPKSDYDLTSSSRMILSTKYEIVKKTPPVKIPSFLPLTPYQLMRIVFNPQTIDLGKMAPDNHTRGCVTIINNNSFAIRVYVKSDKSYLIPTNGGRATIEGNTSHILEFDFCTEDKGKYLTEIRIIVNEFHICDVKVIAHVVDKIVTLKSDRINMPPNRNDGCVPLYNCLATPISFNWDLGEGNFTMTPTAGNIPPRQTILCYYKYNHSPKFNNMMEAALSSSNVFVQYLSIVKEVVNMETPIAFQYKTINFGDIPLNLPIRKEIFIKNCYSSPLAFEIINPDVYPGLSIMPKSGTIREKSDFVVIVIACITDVCNFKARFDFDFGFVQELSVTVMGTVIYPSISIKPSTLTMKKIVPYAYIRKHFQIENTSRRDVILQFMLEDSPEFKLTNSKDEQINFYQSLKPGETRVFYLSFVPQDPAAYGFFVPICINNIIGPVLQNNTATYKPAYFLNRAERHEIDYLNFRPLPSSISVLKLNCSAGTSWLNFSSLNLKFDYFSERRRIFKITCEKDEPIKMCLNLSALGNNFQFTSIEGEPVEYLKNSALFTIPQEKSVTFEIFYTPETYGIHKVEIPIYVKGFLDKAVFNVLKLTGSFSEPSIICDTKVIYFPTIPPYSIRERHVINLLGDHHSSNCHLNLWLKPSDFSVILLEPRGLSATTPLPIAVVFFPTVNCSIITTLKISCSCKGEEADVKIFANSDFGLLSAYLYYYNFPSHYDNSDNKIVTRSYSDHSMICSHKTLCFNDNLSFPLFPKNDDTSELAKFLYSTIKFLESWISSQGFYKTKFFTIPNMIGRYPALFLNFKEIKANNLAFNRLALVDLLINWAGPSAEKVFNRIQQPRHDSDIPMFSYMTYRDALKFLHVQGMYASHISPELLLPYSYYLHFKEYLYDDENKCPGPPLNRDEFLLRSTQCWLDLLLQIYKLFILRQVIKPPLRTSGPNGEFRTYYDQEKSGLLSPDTTECILLLWLEFFFNKQKNEIWKSPEDKAMNSEKKRVRHFGIDLADGKVLACVTSAFCPYILHELQQMYCKADNYEKKLHNACCLTEVWKKLTLSFPITPLDILEGNFLNMLILVSTMYQVLPHFYPSEPLTLPGMLGKVTSKKIGIHNTSEFMLAYTVVFLCNTANMFYSSTLTPLIAPDSSLCFNINYRAKSVFPSGCIMILSGETGGQRYAKSMVIPLVGVPNIKEPLGSFELKCTLFVPQVETFKIPCPYEDATEARLFHCVRHPAKSKSDFVSWHDWNNFQVPRQIFTKEPTLPIAWGGFALTLEAFFVLFGKKSFLIYLMTDVGDYCILIEVTVEKSFFTIPVEVPLTKEFFSESCICNKRVRLNCPKTVMLKLKSKNEILWDKLKEMIAYSTDSAVADFWNKYLDFPIGMQILGIFMKNSFSWNFEGFDTLLLKDVEFKLNNLNTSAYSVQNSFVVQDPTSRDEISIYFHWNSQNLPRNGTCSMVFMANHFSELRAYNLVFVSQYGEDLPTAKRRIIKKK